MSGGGAAEVLRAPMPYFGGKRRIAHVVWERFGDVKNYVEPFFGSGAVLLARPHAARIETVNDADAFLCNFWRSVQWAPDEVAAYADWPVSEPDLHSRHLWLVNEGAERIRSVKTDPFFHDPLVAGYWVWGICQWIGSGWCVKPEWTGRANAARRSRGINAERWSVRPQLSNGGVGVHRKIPSQGDAGPGLHRPGTGGERPSLADANDWAPSRQLPELLSRRGVHRDPEVNPPIQAMMRALCDRLRRVRVCCGDWSRVVTPSVTIHNGLTGVFLDPPYDLDERDSQIYTHDAAGVAAEVRAWAIANGDNSQLRIALCGYDVEAAAMPAGWANVPWKAHGGYGLQGDGRGRANRHREVVWFSRSCLPPTQPGLFDAPLLEYQEPADAD